MQASFTRPLATPLLLVTDPRFALHETPLEHPERPGRLEAALRGLAQSSARTLPVIPEEATREQLLRVHTADYLDSLEAAFREGSGRLDEDTFFGPHTRDAALRAAGGACALAEGLLHGRSPVGALLARPPGHHATADKAMGFCFLNNVAVAAAHARALGAERVAIVDWDVHHGNGTQDLFWTDPNVLFLSLHQYPLYPGTGAVEEAGGAGALGRTINIPLAAGSDGAHYARAFERVVLPVLRSFEPDVLFISAGFDAHERDPLAELSLDAATYGWMAARLRSVALELGHGRVGLILEGGYDLEALETSLCEVLRGLQKPVLFPAAPRENPLLKDDFLRSVLRVQRPYWPGVL